MENGKKTALITGASSGIGYELAKLFARDKYDLIIVAQNSAELEAKADEFRQSGINVTTYACNLSNKAEVEQLCAQVQSSGAVVNVLVNDAGAGCYGLFKDTDIERELEIINLNIGALVMLTKHFVKEMVQRQEGKILNLASIASKVPGPWQSVYHGTKAFVLSFSEAIRQELTDSGVTVTSLLPGPTDTEFFATAHMEDSRIVQDKGALADPAKVAEDGYQALMNGDDKVISGFKNKMQVAMANITPDATVAKMMDKQQKPVEQS